MLCNFKRTIQQRPLYNLPLPITMSSKGTGKKETLAKKSAAEFFSEHQQIAGFDNPGKSLFTTIREFVENSLDAAESMHVLPEIELCVEEFSEAEHNELNGIRTNGSKADLSKEDEATETIEKPTKSSKASKGDAKESKEQMYYLIRCTDNGCGIPEENIGDMLGRVLSGSKHGIRQTRGKFGLGAKMVSTVAHTPRGIYVECAHSVDRYVFCSFRRLSGRRSRPACRSTSEQRTPPSRPQRPPRSPPPPWTSTSTATNRRS